MQIRENELSKILGEIDKYLTRDLNIIAIGGTALTLLGKKESTKDIDLCFEDEKDLKRFIEIAEKLGYIRDGARLKKDGLFLDLYSGGYIFCVQLAADYRQKASAIRKMIRIHLFSLAPVDLIITKTARLNERDIQDIQTIFESFDIDKEELILRYFETMDKSMVRDAKLNLLWIADKFKFSEKIKERIESWKHA